MADSRLALGKFIREASARAAAYFGLDPASAPPSIQDGREEGG